MVSIFIISIDILFKYYFYLKNKKNGFLFHYYKTTLLMSVCYFLKCYDFIFYSFVVVVVVCLIFWIYFWFGLVLATYCRWCLCWYLLHGQKEISKKKTPLLNVTKYIEKFYFLSFWLDQVEARQSYCIVFVVGQKQYDTFSIIIV